MEIAEKYVFPRSVMDAVTGVAATTLFQVVVVGCQFPLWQLCALLRSTLGKKIQMEISKPQSFFQDIRSRELHGFRAPKRPYINGLASDFNEIGAIAAEHNGPPMAISFGKTCKNSDIVAMSDEDGYLSLFDTRRKFSASASFQENADKTKVCDWVAHQNAVFDVCWIKDDTQIMTASGDQTIKVWDIQEKKCTAILMGHTGSVKSLCPHPTNPEIIVSGSRDGSFALWDMRCNSSSKNIHGEIAICSTAVVKGAHLFPRAKRVRRGKAASMSITSVLYLKDEVSIATAGAVDSIVKFWDTRSLKNVVTQTSPHLESTEKSVLSPDAAHMLSGSSDGNAYIWQILTLLAISTQVNKPQEDPVILKSHDGEVTAVDWSHFEVGKMATSSDDFTNSYGPSTNSPSVIRRRVMAIPDME
ncbi:Transducin/WD40 repeat-like superfamily protein [Prunus dulcis]|uniref:Transducin/WD40 repeat-like superfamily protein n=1 Tax=Prunus dulcis TaxID=3755 RepID=A0A4Y1R8X6_PRUDU|nr:Transducin/WD40 repeat-like superfamily protein [Prunus dulcis]